MEVPQGYKQTSVGIIPEDWKIIEFGNIATVSKTKYTPKDSESLKCIELEHINQHTGDLNGWTSSNFQKSTKNVFEKDDILFGKLRPYLRKYWLADSDGVCSSEIWVLKPKDLIISKFLFRAVQTHRFIQIANVSSGSKMPRADWDFVSQYPFSIPPLPEQQKIAEILSTWDTAIETCRKTIEQLKQRNKGLAQQFLTPAENWQKYKVKDVLKEISRPVSWDDEKFYDLISVRRRSGGIFYRQTLQGKEILTKNLSTVKNGDFLISKMQIVHGASALVCENFENMNVSGSYIVTGCRNEEIMDIRFFNYLSKTKRFYHLSYISSYGVHIEKMTFDFKDFQNHSITLPSIAKQKKIITILDTAANELRLYQDKLCYLQNQKKGLMQQLLTGKVRTV